MAVTVSMASCSLEEVVEQPTPQAIGFSSFVGKPTKAVTQTEKTNLGSFQVYGGYATNTSVFEGVSVISNDQGSNWNYTNTQYWVPGQSYKFAAMGPTDALTGKGTLSFDYGTGHLTLQDYTEANLENSKDIVYAGNVTRTTNSPLETQDYEAVPFTFGHIMSWIKIKFVHKMTSGYEITVSDVTVTGVQTKGTFNGTDWNMANPATSATFENQEPNEDSYNQDDKVLDAEGDNCLVDFIAIPQTVTTLNISFKLTVQDDKGAYLVGSDGNSKLFTAQAINSAVWQKDYVYTYTAELNETVLDLKPITFTANVNSWTNTADGGSLTFN